MACSGSPPPSPGSFLASAPSRRCSTPITPLVRRGTYVSTPPSPTAGKPVPGTVISTGWCSIAIGRRILPRRRSASKVRAYVKNHGLGFWGALPLRIETRKYLPDFIVLVDDGKGTGRPVARLVVEIKGLPSRGCQEKKSTMDTYWVPGVNHLGTYGLGLRRVHRRVPDAGRLRQEGRKRIQQDDRGCGGRDRSPGTTVAKQPTSRTSSRSPTTTPSAGTSPPPNTSRCSTTTRRIPNKSATRATPTSTRNWSGAAKDEQDWSDLVVLRRRSTSRKRCTPRR